MKVELLQHMLTAPSNGTPHMQVYSVNFQEAHSHGDALRAKSRSFNLEPKPCSNYYQNHLVKQPFSVYTISSIIV